MIRRILLGIVLIGILSGHSNFMLADPPDRMLARTDELGTTVLACTPDGRQVISGDFRRKLRV